MQCSNPGSGARSPARLGSALLACLSTSSASRKYTYSPTRCPSLDLYLGHRYCLTIALPLIYFQSSYHLTQHLTTAMTSITQLLSPWPTVTKQSIVLREHYMPPPNHQDHLDSMSQHQQQPPSPPNDASGDNPSGGPDSDGGDGNTDGRKGYGKRELSTSKRAAQNRAAQVGPLTRVRCLLY